MILIMMKAMIKNRYFYFYYIFQLKYSISFNQTFKKGFIRIAKHIQM